MEAGALQINMGILFTNRKFLSVHSESMPRTRRQILDSSTLKEFAGDNFKFDENGSKLSKRVENIVEKGEIARYEEFLIFPQCFHSHTMTPFDAPSKQAL